MIKQDYLIRMIQEIISLIINALLRKKKISYNQWEEYESISRQIVGFKMEELTQMSPDDIMRLYENDNDRMGKIELVAVLLLKFAEEIQDNIILKSKLKQTGLKVLEQLNTDSKCFSLARLQLINMLKIDINN